MDLDDDFEAVSPSQDPSTPPPERKLKRLKKSKPAVERSSVPETLDSAILATQDEPRSGSSSTSDDLEEELGWRSSSDPIRSAEDASSLGSKRALDFDSMLDQSDGIGSDKAEEADNIRPAINEYDEEEKEMNIKKKRRRAEDVGDDDMVKPQRGRRQHLTQLRAETQRLLRETRDASFKPAPFVQKPISSVLEKIRRRKLEVSEKFVSRTRHTIEDEDGYSSDDEVEIVIVPQNPSPERRDNKGMVELETEGLTFHENLDTCQADSLRDIADHVVHDKITQGSDKEPKQTFQAAIEETLDVGKEPKQTFRAPIGDTQDLFSDSQTSDSKDELADMTLDSPLEEDLAPSVLAMNLKLDSAPPDDISSDEEDNDKENVSPESVDASPVLDGDPAKAFVDDEAEEDDDSDNDLLRFHDDEDDDGSSEDSEELGDMIATQYDEKQSDIEKRMELHQKLLHQQDAAKTKNLMLRCGLKNNEKRFLMEDGDMAEVDEGEEEYADDKAIDFDVAVKNHSVRMSIKKLQELIPRMFTDADDVYISSDDEEAEKRLATECLSVKAKNHTKLSSPAADARSSALFTHIKKVNHIPENKRKAKPNIPETLLMGGKSKTSSKPSFIGRGSNCSAPPSRRHGSNMMRSFIFEREESSGIKSTISAAAAEDGSETIQRESQTSRTSIASRKLSSSQSKLNSQSREEARAESSSSNSSSGTPLLEMLRRSSLRSTSHCAQDASVACNNSSIFAAFKLDKKKPSSHSLRKSFY